MSLSPIILKPMVTPELAITNSLAPIVVERICNSNMSKALGLPLLLLNRMTVILGYAIPDRRL